MYTNQSIPFFIKKIYDILHRQYLLYMKKISLHILRIGLGITFVWLGILIWVHPAAWGSFIQPWANALLPTDIETFMRGAALFDMLIGAWLIIGVFVWIPAALATLHIFGVLLTTTQNLQTIIVRDIGLFASSLALFLETRRKK